MTWQYLLEKIKDKVAAVTLHRLEKGRLAVMKQKQKSAKFLCGIDKE
jgi:hypothetical protein